LLFGNRQAFLSFSPNHRLSIIGRMR
jgi:hypothetical protein